MMILPRRNVRIDNDRPEHGETVRSCSLFGLAFLDGAMRSRYLLALLLLPTFAAAGGFETFSVPSEASRLRQVPTTPSASDVMADLTINLYSHQAEPVVRGESGGGPLCLTVPL